MARTRVGSWLLVPAVVFLCAVSGVTPGRTPDEDAPQRKQLLALNEVTGDDPIRGHFQRLVKDPEGTKNLLAVAVKMAKEKPVPFNYNAAYILGRTAQGLKEIDTSVTFYRLCFDEAARLKSGNKISQAFLGLIAVHYENGKFEESEKLCREFLEMRGDETIRRLKPAILRQMIQSLAKQGKSDEANKLLDDLIKAQPENWLTLELRGWVQREAGQFGDAAKTYEEVLQRIDKDDALDKEEKSGFSSEVRYILSGVYVDAKQVDKAAEHLKVLLKEEPENPSYNNDLGYIWADHDMNLEEAEKLIRKAIEEDRKQQRKLNPELKPEEVKANAAYLDSLGWVLYKQKKYKEAKPYLEEAVKEEEGKHIEIYDHLAEVHMALGDKAAAVATWKKALEVAGSTRREQQRKAEVEKKLKAHQ
jgi:tetratricopeptide (TPR) repeat protein